GVEEDPKLVGPLKRDYRLPTDREFEVYYRAGATTTYPWGDSFPPPATSPTTRSRRTASSTRPPSAASRPTPSAFTTWPATCGSGSPTRGRAARASPPRARRGLERRERALPGPRLPLVLPRRLRPPQHPPPPGARGAAPVMVL